MNTQKKVTVAMSGGVDSSVAAFLLKEAGYQVDGVNLRLYEKESSCGSLSDVEDARQAADRLGMDFFVYDFKDLFRCKVIDRFIESYRQAKTPNPCIDCNRFVKFDALIEKVIPNVSDYIATGHYANVEYDSQSGRYLLKKAADLSKDQSYVLYSLTQKQLSHILFPLGNLTKTKVREIAEQNGFLNAHKKDSQDICFVPDGDYAAFIKQDSQISFPEGNFVDKNGVVLGRHKGIIHYTVGQRKGLGLSFPCPMYVLSKNRSDNTVTLGPIEELYQSTLIAKDVNFISVEKIDGIMSAGVKIRYNQKEQPATIEQLDDSTVKITFLEPQKAITKGQAAVFYDGDTVIGGGTIQS